MELHAFSDFEAMNEALLLKIKGKLLECVENGQKFTIALSGGNTPRSLYYRLGKYLSNQPNYLEKVKIYQVDERFVPSANERSNQKMIRSNFPEVTEFVFFDVDSQDISAEESASNYQLDLIRSLGTSKEDSPKFDMVILGMGEDGHTASLFPNETIYVNSLQNQEKLVITTFPEGQETRLSLTPSIISSSDDVILLFTGTSKTRTLKRALQSGDKIKYPILSIWSPEIQIYTEFNPELLQIEEM